MKMREPVPGYVRQVPLLVNKNPGHLLQPAAARPALKTLATAIVVPSALPRRPVQQAALQAARPEREAAGRYPTEHSPVVEPLRNGRSTEERVVDAQGVADLVHIAELSFQRVAAGFVPVPNIRHDHQTVRIAHDGADRTVAQEVRQADRYVSFLGFPDRRLSHRSYSTHRASALPSFQRLRMECSGAPQAGADVVVAPKQPVLVAFVVLRLVAELPFVSPASQSFLMPFV